jgi:hypothetical protein
MRLRKGESLKKLQHTTAKSAARWPLEPAACAMCALVVTLSIKL